MDIRLKDIKGIGAARLKLLEAQGIKTVRQLLLWLPVDYRDLSDVRELGSLYAGEIACVRVWVKGTASIQRVKRLVIVRTMVSDGTDTMQAIWFNQPWLKQQLIDGRELLLYGKCEIKYGQLMLISPTIESGEGLVPIYRAIKGIPIKTMRQMMRAALSHWEGQWKDDLPESLRRRHGLCELNFAMRQAHFPDAREAMEAARHRIAFEELLMYQCGLMLTRQVGRKGVRIPCTEADAQEFWQRMPFTPTGAQIKVLHEILHDLNDEAVMGRLVQGDVGSGKTALAFGALYVTAKSGYQGALMVPTEILAQQHYETAQTLLAPHGIRCGLLTGSMTVKQKREAHAQIAAGDWDVAIGTHALISKGVDFQKLGLVVTDEQHRFGVRHRALLSGKGNMPNVLVMSATPIPRTLALILFGDLEVSVVDELPPGRTPIKTRIVSEAKRDGMYGFLLDEVRQGRQVYVVCPLVEESETIDALPAEVVYENLRTGMLKDIRIGLVHGRMAGKDKEAVLNAFHLGELDLLVSTTVIEVGVNVPNATVMVVENAERFGLAQLHQLRGRVGRGVMASWCFLMAEPNERLELMVKTSDGFKIAQKDLELRGPGEMFGYRQSGAVAAGLSKLMGNTQLLKETNDEAKYLITHPDSEESKIVLAAAKVQYDRMIEEISLS